MTLNDLEQRNGRYLNEFGKRAFQLITASSSIELIDQEYIGYGNEYDSCLSRLLDKHAPLRTVRRKPRRNAEWFDSECHKAKKIMR